MRRLAANIPKVYALDFAWSFLLVQAVIVPYFASNGLSMAQVFAVFTAFSLTLCALELPTGYFSDLFGRKTALVLASIFKGGGGVCLACARGFWGFVVGYVLIGIGNSLFSGTDTAVLYETRDALPEAERGKHASLFGKRIFYCQLGMMAGALIGAQLAMVSLQLTATLNAVFAWTSLVIALTIVEPPRTKLAIRSHRQNLKRVVACIAKGGPRLRGLIGLAAVYGAAPVLAVIVFQGAWRTSGVPLYAFGYLTAAYQLTGAVTGRLAHRLEPSIGARGALLVIALLPAIGFWGASAGAVVCLVGFGLLLEVNRGLCQVVLNEAINARIGSEIRATVNSLVSFGTRIVLAIAGPLLGVISDRYGFSAALEGLAILYSVILGAIVVIVASSQSATAEVAT